jgi:hypothetical protein
MEIELTKLILLKSNKINCFLNFDQNRKMMIINEMTLLAQVRFEKRVQDL